ncbi:exported protein [Agaricicola taiwanensis]|uniref:Exported protein n=1 Tax=Agaricicola taiwanensis TaxID=591372 RepID=A0A8J2YKS1_9RHOB|nr:tripartite tricarboxylate transporter substrate binding protein [Agaricicola taiwanensis]GGE49273.1 exported protein [Agaricicola taiwanensis]
MTIEQKRAAATVSRRMMVSLAVMAFGLALPATASAQDYPTQPIKLIVPGTAGGGMDVIARVIGDRIGTILKQPVVVENKPGAGGNIAVDYVAKSKPDGYTMLIGQTAHFSINPSLYSSLPFDPVKDFQPVTLLADAPNVVMVNAESPIKNLDELVAAAKASEKGLSLATPGNGTVSHLTGELFQKTAQVKFNHIPYKGAAAALTDVMGGRVDFMLSSIPTALSQIKAGKLRPIAVSAAKRSPSLPDVPTIGEQGYPGFDAGTWYGLLVPAGTPTAVVEKLNAAANEAIEADDIREKIRQEGGDSYGGTSAEFAALMKADSEKWSKVVKESGAKVD